MTTRRAAARPWEGRASGRSSRRSAAQDPSSATQRIARPRAATIRQAAEFRAQYPGMCAACGQRFPVRTVVLRAPYGYRHAVCPKDRGAAPDGDS